jgi:hypothetical protein
MLLSQFIVCNMASPRSILCGVRASVGSLLIVLIASNGGCSQSGAIENGAYAIEGVGIPSDVMVYHATEQHGQNWCWAASAQMALSTQSVNISQEKIVIKLFGRLVDSPGGIPHFISLSGKYGSSKGNLHVTCEVGDGPPPPEYLIASLRQKRPVILACNNPGLEIGHAVVATAVIYKKSAGAPEIVRVIVRDPALRGGKRILEALEYRDVMFHAVYRVTPTGF